MTKRVFVVGAYNPHGGDYMAYQVALIFHKYFGHQVLVVEVGSHEPTNMFDYAVPFESISLESMERIMTSDDILIANPSFSDCGFGNWFPGKKLMYAQDVSTFRILDCGFDKYICVSQFVADFIADRYKITAPVIPAFVDIPSSIEVISWRARQPLSILVHTKRKSRLLDGLNAKILNELRHRVSGIDFEPVVADGAIPHRKLLERLGSRRYLLTLSVAEGFGLVPLEAMAVGAAVLGFDAYGGREYMEPTINCNVARYPDVVGLVDAAEAALKDESIAERLAFNGRATATRFTRERFEQLWIKEIGAFLAKS
jgi:hypothetical protein